MLNYVTHLGYFTTRKKRYQLKKSNYNVILQLFCFSILATLLLDIQQIQDWFLRGLAYLNKKVRFFFLIPKSQVSESFSLAWLYFVVYCCFLEAVQTFKFYLYALVQSLSKWYPLHPVTSYQFCSLFFILFMLFLPFCRYLMFTWMLKSRIIFQHNLIYMLLYVICILYIIYIAHMSHIYIHIYIPIYIYIYIYIYRYMYIGMYICIYTFLYTYTYIYIYTHTHTHTYTYLLLLLQVFSVPLPLQIQIHTSAKLSLDLPKYRQIHI